VRSPRVRAPQLRGRRWLNTDGVDLTLADLRGRIVLLDFWTSCCVNCLHVLDELRSLEEGFTDVLVVVGVHSPKFPHEAEPAALDAAVERYGVRHAVLDDADLSVWSSYAAKAWPTLVLVDPEGYVVAQRSGEGHGPELGTLIRSLEAEHSVKGTLRRGEGPYVAPSAPPSVLSFPSRALPLPGGSLLVADTGHHQLVELAEDGESELRRLGSGTRGFVDGPTGVASFAEPQGFALLPPDVAGAVGYDLVVADRGNHALRGVRLLDGSVRTVAGTGRQLRRREGGGAALEQDLSSPWDAVWFDDQVVIAMAGVHQLWAFDPSSREVRVLAGTTAEGLLDGAAERAWLAQPSGLTVADDALWFVDAETSALRSLHRTGTPDRRVPVVRDSRLANTDPVAGAGYEVRTHVGQGLFEFGRHDGPADRALLQHPLGLAVAPDGTVLVADTFNGAVRGYDPVSSQVSTVVDGLAEPVDVVVVGEDLLVLEQAAHRLTRVRRGPTATRVPAVELPAGPVSLTVVFTPPSGQVADHRWGEPARLDVSVEPPELLVAGAGETVGLGRDLVVAAGFHGVLRVRARTATCDTDVGHPACHLHRQEWEIPVRTGVPGSGELVLRWRGA